MPHSAQKRLPLLTVPQAEQVQTLGSLVSAEGLGSNPDKLHFNAESLYEFGLRYFAEFDKLHDFEKLKTEAADQDTKRTKMEEL